MLFEGTIKNGQLRCISRLLYSSELPSHWSSSHSPLYASPTPLNPSSIPSLSSAATRLRTLASRARLHSATVGDLTNVACTGIVVCEAGLLGKMDVGKVGRMGAAWSISMLVPPSCGSSPLPGSDEKGAPRDTVRVENGSGAGSGASNGKNDMSGGVFEGSVRPGGWLPPFISRRPRPARDMRSSAMVWAGREGDSRSERREWRGRDAGEVGLRRVGRVTVSTAREDGAVVCHGLDGSTVT